MSEYVLILISKVSTYSVQDTMTKNIGKSIRTRLLNLAKEEKQEYMKVLVRYLHERLLFRISASPYKSHFLLKDI